MCMYSTVVDVFRLTNGFFGPKSTNFSRLSIIRLVFCWWGEYYLSSRSKIRLVSVESRLTLVDFQNRYPQIVEGMKKYEAAVQNLRNTNTTAVPFSTITN